MPPAPRLPEAELRRDWVPRRTPSWFVVADSRGRVDWSFTGDDAVTLLVLEARTVVADSGGTLNAALLTAGLVDEIDIVTLPGLVGGVGTPSIMDGRPLEDTGVPIRLELLDVGVLDGGAVRAR